MVKQVGRLLQETLPWKYSERKVSREEVRKAWTYHWLKTMNSEVVGCGLHYWWFEMPCSWKEDEGRMVRHWRRHQG
jgi:hypothetical protein